MTVTVYLQICVIDNRNWKEFINLSLCNVILLSLPGHQRKDQWELLPAAILMDKGVDAEELPGLLEGILHNLWKRNERHIKFKKYFTLLTSSYIIRFSCILYSIFIFYLEGSIQEPPSRFTQKLPLEWCGENKVPLSSNSYIHQKEVLTLKEILIQLK